MQEGQGKGSIGKRATASDVVYGLGLIGALVWYLKHTNGVAALS